MNHADDRWSIAAITRGRFLMSESESEVGRHPVGTLAIVGVYGLLFATGWFLVYVYVYLSRGAVTP
jgi:hypothetical protein